MRDAESNSAAQSGMRRTALIATLGAEPQVITLAVDALRARGTMVDRVVVLHTLDTLEPIRSSLRALWGVFVDRREYGSDLHYVPHALGDLHGVLEDVTTAGQVDIAFQSIYSLIRQMKHAGWHLVMCIAGGRKTLSFTALSVAQVLFDHDDTVWHLVSEPELQVSRSFHATRAEQITLVQMPLRVWLPAEGDTRWRYRNFLEHSLTPAEREVALLLLREGLSNQALAEQLGKSVRTIENQLSRIYAKAERELGFGARVDRVVLLSAMGGNPYVE